jgi:hypothetical protein
MFDALKAKHVCSVEALVRNVVSAAPVSGDKKALASPAAESCVLLAAMSSDGDSLVVVLGPRRWGSGGEGAEGADAADHHSLRALESAKPGAPHSVRLAHGAS